MIICNTYIIHCSVLQKGRVYMADDKTLKPKSFRIDDETAEKFKEISAIIDGNQQETLAKLIEAFEFQSGKAILTEKKSDIEQFEKYVNALTRMYMGSLEDNQNITETVRTEFEALLQSKDTIIQDLQAQLKVAKQLKEESNVKAATCTSENSRLNEYIKSLQNEYNSKLDDMESMLLDKESLNKTLIDSCNTMRSQISVMTKESEEIKELRKKLADVTLERDSLLIHKEEARKTLEKVNKEYEGVIADLKQRSNASLEQCKEQMQITLDKAVLETERKHQEQLQILKEQKQAEIDKYQQKYFELLEQLKNRTVIE